MPPRDSIILLDAVAIKAAHQLGCWNALRQTYTLHSVPLCVQEATQVNRSGKQLVARSNEEVTAEITIGAVTTLMRVQITLRLGNRIDLDAGERDLLAYALTLQSKVWWLCGPDNGSVNALHFLGMLDRMISLQTLSHGAGQKINAIPHHYTERWLADRRTRFLLENPQAT